MKWQLKRHKYPKSGEERTRGGFLFLPMLISDEWRWLEIAYWVERFTITPGTVTGMLSNWQKTRWLN